MDAVKKAFNFLGKFLLGAIFVIMGLSQILDWQGSLLALENALVEWSKVTISIDLMQEVLHHLLKRSMYMLAIMVALQVVGGLCLALGYKPRLGSSFLILAVLLSTLLFHAFWIVPKEELATHLTTFVYSLGVLGGLLLAWVQAGGSVKPSAAGNAKK